MQTKWIILIISIFIFILIIGSVISYCSRVVAPNTIENAFINYEQFQEIYNTCQKLDTDLGNMKALPDSDQMFQQFSKQQRIYTIKTQLNRWVEDYNAKSKMWNRGMWKSKKLPYQLNVNEFINY